TSVYRPHGDGPTAGRWQTIFLGVDVDNYAYAPRVQPDAPLAFLGRLHPVKGAHLAIAIAKKAGRRLILAGNRERTADDPDYFDREIAPYLDGRQTSYIGPVDDDQKNGLLGQCAALLFPIDWNEAFGIVMAEAFA